MTNGPPPSDAGSSKSLDSTRQLTSSQNVPSQTMPALASGTQPIPPNYTNYAWQSYWNQYNLMPPHNAAGQQPASMSAQSAASNPYAAMYPPSGYSQPLQNLHSQPVQYTPQKSTPTPIAQANNIPSLSTTPTVKSPPPLPPKPPTPPPPSPETYKNWDNVIKKFLDRTGMVQASKGLEKDMLVINPVFEQNHVPSALEELSRELHEILARISKKESATADNEDMQVDETAERDIQTLDERKLAYVKLGNGSTPRTQSSINKSISQFLARTRARNDASNKSEFLLSLAEKKRKLQEDGQAPVQFASSSCARVDARTIDREKQMKYDIAKNDEGPLARSRQKQAQMTARTSYDTANGKQPLASSFSRPGTGLAHDNDDIVMATVTPARYPALDERLNNIETHLAIRYVPSPPRTLLARLKYVEEHINRLERDYPPWAALHFNQPRRGWPPPPRTTPIIVPAHLRSVNSDKTSSASTPVPTSTPNPTTPNSTPLITTPTDGVVSAPVKKTKTKSSLHKAVLERLEVQKAMNEMNTKGGFS